MNISNQSSGGIEIILFGIFLSLIALITSIGNIIVLMAFYFDKQLRTINDYFILNMAIADFLVGFICIPFYIPFSLNEIWPFGRFFCKIWVTIDDVSTMASVINIVAISINRYWSIAYPISYRKYARLNFVYLSMGFIWFLSFINFAPGIWLISFFIKINESGNECLGDYNQSFLYMIIAQFNYFIWPFLLLCLFNILIMFNIWKRTKKMDRSKHFIKNKSLKFQINKQEKTYSSCNSLVINQQDFVEKKEKEQYKSSLDCPEGTTTYLTSSIEQYSSYTKTKQTNSLNSSIKSTTKDHCLSSPLILSRTYSNLNLKTSSVYSTVDYPYSSQIPVNQSKSNIRLSQRDLRIARDKKAARSLFILVIVFLIFLFPYVTCAVASTAGFNISSKLMQISFWLLWLNSTFNPFLYPFIQIKYRRAYSKLFQSFLKYFHIKQ
ncbi:unnamed protein product [Adineta steineri]|uniref:G-protein coupled receptors family 1 profile domain-containing protein n=1 Tax=Adineta steineri TaxID=433720 RepID=A0A818IKY1_9BILA|nr:unnamed protein product [Adineta steineri]CAF1321799.1 unnamed protein product [Adineta steineri]CAF3521543.1 unnamed protein product [Adineta steineri]CAF3585589.1 unnamed protein product [Adineta steineri]